MRALLNLFVSPIVASSVLAAGLLALVAGEVRAEEKTTKVAAGDISLNIPETWKKSEAKRQFRVAEFEIPAIEGVEGTGELAVFYFGEGGAGGVDANVTRWINQFESEGRKVKTLTGKSEQGDYTLVDLSGTYKKPIGPPIQMKSKSMPDWRMLGVILQTEKGAYFLKFDGPAKLIAAEADRYRTAFGGKAADEKERKAAKEE